MGFHCSRRIILKKKSLISYQTEEFFFLKRDPNYVQPQISMYEAATCFNKV